MPNNINLDWSEYEGLKNRVADLEAQLAKAAEPIEPLDETTQAKALAAALEITKFAIGNLPPETVIGWPHENLIELADALEQLGTYAPELPITIRAFARECHELAIFRASRERAARDVLGITANEENTEDPSPVST